MNLSLDGFMSGPNDELDWHVESWSEEMGDKLLEMLGKQIHSCWGGLPMKPWRNIGASGHSIRISPSGSGHRGSDEQA
jgi:hypothetical protein